MSGVHNITNDKRITNFQDVTVTFIIDSFETRNSRGDYTLAWNAVSKYFTRGGFYSLALNPHPIPHTFTLSSLALAPIICVQTATWCAPQQSP